jgi:hypothetical protein
MTPEELRAEFVRLLTVDSETRDRRRKDFNQAVFFPPNDPPCICSDGWCVHRHVAGKAVWDSTDLGMVLEKFDRAVRNLKVQEAAKSVAKLSEPLLDRLAAR